MMALFKKTHGKTRTPIYVVWMNMKARCQKPSNKEWSNYGGRGISVCDAWLSFENFYADMGDPPAGHRLDRKDNDGNYEPDNCRWATQGEQCNNRRNNRLITLFGRTQTCREWEREFNVRKDFIGERIRRGWPVERVFSDLEKWRLPT